MAFAPQPHAPLVLFIVRFLNAFVNQNLSVANLKAINSSVNIPSAIRPKNVIAARPWLRLTKRNMASIVKDKSNTRKANIIIADMLIAFRGSF